MKTIPIHLTCISLGIVALSILSAPAHAQSSGDKGADRISESTGPKRFWQVRLSGGSYMVALDRITSISKHNYLMDGNIAVTEVVIDTTGNSLARFYYLEPADQDASHTGQKGKELPDKEGQGTGVDLTTAVVRQHPATTHAKTVAFRVHDRGDLDQLLNSVHNAWINGKGRKFSIGPGN